MKTMGKIITGVLIISVIYMYIKNTNKTTKKETKDVCIQTENMDIIRHKHYAEEKLENLDVIFEEDQVVEDDNADIQEVENLNSPSSEHTEPENMSVIELKNLAKEQNIKGYSRMKKAELIEILS